MVKRLKVLAIAALFPVLVHMYMYATFSRLGAFERVRIGEPRGDVVTYLTQNGIECFQYDWMSGSSAYRGSCVFTDPWRRYEVVFDSAGSIVVSKRTELRAHSFAQANPLVLRITRWAVAAFRHSGTE